MSELRKKQKRKRQEAIIKAAMKLVGDKGYRNTSIEEIAREAEVGIATVYNYYRTKSELMLSIINEKVESLLENGKKVIDSPPDKAEDGIHALVEAYFSLCNGHYDKKLFRELLVVFLVEQLSVRKQLMGMDYAMMDQVTGLIKLYQERGQIKPALDPAEISLILYTMIGGALMAFVVDDDMTPEVFLDAMKRQTGLLFAGFAP